MIKHVDVYLLECNEPFYIDIDTGVYEFYFELRDGKLSCRDNFNDLEEAEQTAYYRLMRVPDLERLVNTAVDVYIENECEELRRMATAAKMKDVQP